MKCFLKKIFALLYDLPFRLIMFLAVYVMGAILLIKFSINKQHILKVCGMRSLLVIRYGLTQWRKTFYIPYRKEPPGTFFYLWIITEWAALLNESKPAISNGSARKKILVWVPTHIGDLVVAEPLISTLRDYFGARYVDILVTDANTELAEYMFPDSTVYSLDVPLRGVQRSIWRRNLSKKDWNVMELLREKRYGRVIATGGSSFSVFFREYVLAEQWIGPVFALKGYGRHDRLLALKDNAGEKEWMRLLRLVEVADVGTVESRKPCIVVRERSLSDARGRLKATGIAEDETVIALVPGAGCAGKIYDAARYRRVVIELRKAKHCAIIILGGKSDVAKGSLIAQGTPDVVNLCGKTTVLDCIGLLAVASLYVGNDCGLLHIAAAVGTSTLSLWGGSLPEVWAPEGRNHRYLESTGEVAACAPWKRRQRVMRGKQRMNSIPVEEVVNTACSLVLQQERDQ
jgi:heptosyltransferase-2